MSVGVAQTHLLGLAMHSDERGGNLLQNDRRNSPPTRECPASPLTRDCASEEQSSAPTLNFHLRAGIRHTLDGT